MLHPTNERGQYVSEKVGRNEPCSNCGVKWKKCLGTCLDKGVEKRGS